jgi:hypothetical protein
MTKRKHLQIRNSTAEFLIFTNQAKEDRAKCHIPMTMEDWVQRLDRFLEADDREILQNSGTVTAQTARSFAEDEFEKYRIKQNRLFESDFDREIKRIED